MENKSWNKVLERVDSLVSDILESELYLSYQNIADQLEKHERAMSYIEQIKAKQKEIVLSEARGENTASFEREVLSLQKELECIPLYQEYLEKQKELDFLFQSLKGFLEEHLDHVVSDFS